MKGEVRNHSFRALKRLIVMDILGFWLLLCWQWIPLQTKCNKVLFVGSAISRSTRTAALQEDYMKDWISYSGMTSRVIFASGASYLRLSLTHLAAANYSRRVKAMALLVSRCMPNNKQCYWTFHFGWLDWHIKCFA